MKALADWQAHEMGGRLCSHGRAGVENGCLAEEFVHSAHRHAHRKHIESSYQNNTRAKSDVRPAKKARIEVADDVTWAPSPGCTGVEIRSDSSLAIGWLTGDMAVKNGHYKAGLSSILRASSLLLAEPSSTVRAVGAELYRHIYRELNGAADALAADRQDSLVIYVDDWPCWLRISCDGSRRGGLVGCGWILEGSDGTVSNPKEWQLLATASWCLPHNLDALEAEMCALQSATRFLHEVLVQRQRPRSNAVMTISRPQLWKIRLKHPDQYA